MFGFSRILFEFFDNYLCVFVILLLFVYIAAVIDSTKALKIAIPDSIFGYFLVLCLVSHTKVVCSYFY